MQLKPGFCVECGCTRIIANRHFMLCIPHNQQRLDKKKEEKNMNTGKQIVTTLKRQALQRKRKITGELEVFKKIAAERPHVCFVTNTPILKLSVWNMAHVLPKSTHPLLRLEPENIVLVQQWVHDIYDHGDRSKLEKYPGYKMLMKLQDEMRELNLTLSHQNP